MMYSRFLQSSLRDPAWLAVFISILLSIINILSDDNINSDGILYVETARIFLEQGFQASIAHYNWPFYSVIIATVSQLTGLGFETSAHVLNVFLLGLLAYVFVRCSEALGGNHRVALFAAILLITNIAVNDYRDLIVRDFGYWAFFFTAILFFLKYASTDDKKYALGFSISMLLATLFRIEGIVFFVLMPALLLFQAGHFKERLLRCLIISAPMFIGVIAVIAYIGLSASNEVGRLFEGLNFLQRALANISSGIAEKGKGIVAVMGYGNRSMGTESVLAILFMILISKIYNVVGFISTIFAFSTFQSPIQRQKINSLGMFIGVIGINLFVLIVVLLASSFLSSRYAITLGLLITLLASFSLAAFFNDELEQKLLKSKVWQQRTKIFLSVILIYTVLDGVISSSASKRYLSESGIWLKNNISSTDKLWANETSIYYYADRFVDREYSVVLYHKTLHEELPDVNIIKEQDFDYLAVRVKYKQKGFEDKITAWTGSKPIHRTSNERGDKVLIFKLTP